MFLLFLYFVWVSAGIWLSGYNVFFVHLLLGFVGMDIDSAANAVIKKANILTLTKETGSNDSSENFVTKLVAENKIDGMLY